MPIRPAAFSARSASLGAKQEACGFAAPSRPNTIRAGAAFASVFVSVLITALQT
jgi:hypothetical protein